MAASSVLRAAPRRNPCTPPHCRQEDTMTTDAFRRSVVVTALLLLATSPGLAQTPGGAAPAAGGAVAAPSRFPATSFLTPTKATWESTRSLVLGIVEVMPEDKYDFKPTPAVRTFRENVIHLI